MKLKILFLVFLSVLMIPCWAASQRRSARTRPDDLIGKYEKTLDEMEQSFENVRKLFEQKETQIDRRKDLNHSGILSISQSSGSRNRRQALTKKIAEIDREINSLKSAFENALKANAETAALLQKELIVLGLGDSYDFPYFADTMIRMYRSRGLNADFNKEDLQMQMQKCEDPAVTLRSARFDVNSLRESGVNLSAPNPIPDTCLHYSTFFQFYNLLEFYRLETEDFNRLKDPHAKAELTRRYKQIRPAGMALHHLLNRNAPVMARKVNIPELLKRLDRHYRTEAFKNLGTLDTVFEKSFTLEKKGNSNFDQFLSENLKKTKSSVPAANTSKNVNGSIRVVMKDSFDILNRTASDLRKASVRNELRKARGKRSKDEENDQDQKELLPETLLFRNAAAPAAALPGRQEKTENDAGKDKAEKKPESGKKTENQKPPETGKAPKDGKKKALPKETGESGGDSTPAEEKTESPAIRKTESTSVTEKSVWE